jgi:hypothetical protein
VHVGDLFRQVLKIGEKISEANPEYVKLHREV